MEIEMTERRSDGSDTTTQFVLTVYDFDEDAQQVVETTLSEHGLDPSEDGPFEVVEQDGPVGCFRTAPVEEERDLMRRLQEELVFALANELPAHRILDDEFSRPGDGPRVYSVTAM